MEKIGQRPPAEAGGPFCCDSVLNPVASASNVSIYFWRVPSVSKSTCGRYLWTCGRYLRMGAPN